jgi:hypothetical protein
MDDFKCDFCNTPQDTLFEGWFKAVKENEWNAGTATTGLLQKRRGCRYCVQKAIDSGLTKAKLPQGNNMQDSLTPKQSIAIHKEENRVYYHPEVGFYTTKWVDTGNNEYPIVYPIKLGVSHDG